MREAFNVKRCTGSRIASAKKPVKKQVLELKLHALKHLPRVAPGEKLRGRQMHVR
jgi:hypothetical protein